MRKDEVTSTLIFRWVSAPELFPSSFHKNNWPLILSLIFLVNQQSDILLKKIFKTKVVADFEKSWSQNKMFYARFKTSQTQNNDFLSKMPT